MALTVDLRNAVFTRLDNLKQAGEFSFNDFDLIQTYIPLVNIENLTQRVIILATGYDEQGLTRSGSVERLIPVQVGLQVKIEDPLDTTVGDMWLQLLEELQDSVRGRGVIPGFSWQGTEQLKDEQEVPYSFQRLRAELVFETYFISRFLHVAGPPTIGT